MPFIGQQPTTGTYSKLDAITTSATATYNLLLDGSAYFPSTANQLLVSLNGVMQAPQDSFTVSGSTIIFDSALTSSDSIDFIMAFGDVLNIGTPSDGTVTAGKIAANAVTTAKLAATIAPTNLETTSSTFKMTDLSSNAFYRTGTFTPFYTTSGTTVAYVSDCFTPASYSVQTGNYVRIGDMVHATMFIRIDYSAAGFTNGGATGEYLAFQGLPFKVKNTSNYYPMSSSIYYSTDTAGGWASYNWVGYGSPDKKHIALFYSSAGGTVSPIDSLMVYRTGANNHNSEVMLQLTYQTDEA